MVDTGMTFEDGPNRSADDTSPTIIDEQEDSPSLETIDAKLDAILAFLANQGGQ